MYFKSLIRLAGVAISVATVVACANIGRPEGGPRDETPPEFVGSTPLPGSVNFNDKRITLFFDENLKLDDVMNKVVVSPVQKTTPQVIANGRRLTVELRDTLIPDVTYTIDFSDAIRDLNEGNILDGFAFDFSTGATRDSLVISGMLFEGRTLEPAQGMLVGVYSNLSDSAIRTLPFDRIAKTNQYGQFVIRNLAPGTYNLFAVNDVNRDFHWDRSEDVAFFGESIVPTVENISVTDTLRSVAGRDSTVVRPGVRYLPNDILMTWFNENYRSQYLKVYNRIDSTRVYFEFGAPSDTLPTVTLLNTPAAGKTLAEISRLDHSWARDTLTYWIADKGVLGCDTLLLETRYLRTDSLESLVWQTDTLKVINKDRPKAPKKDKKKAGRQVKEGLDEITGETSAASGDTEAHGDSVAAPALTFIEFAMRGTVQELNQPLRFSASQPIDSIDDRGVKLEVLRDTIWTDAGKVKLRRDSLNRLLEYSLHYEWEPGVKYRFTADSAAIRSIYNIWNKPIRNEFTAKTLDEYSTITLNLSGYGAGEQIVVELLNSSDKPVAKRIADNGTAVFDYLPAGTYYARAFVDANRNGVWDTGNISGKIQPEDTYYYPKKLNLRKNWDISQSWNVAELPVDRQKPDEIKKNKPVTKERRNAPADEEEEDDDPFGNPAFGSQGTHGSGTRQSGSRGRTPTNGLGRQPAGSMQRVR